MATPSWAKASFSFIIFYSLFYFFLFFHSFVFSPSYQPSSTVVILTIKVVTWGHADLTSSPQLPTFLISNNIIRARDCRSHISRLAQGNLPLKPVPYYSIILRNNLFSVRFSRFPLITP